MTKQIRIENADMSDWKVDVEVWETNSNGPTLVEVKQLNNPTDMTNINIWSNRWLVVRERPAVKI